MKEKLNNILDLMLGKELGILPGNLAYSLFLMIIPMLTLIFYFLTSFNLPMDIIQNFISSTFPQGVVELIQPIFTDTISVNSIITIVFGLIVSTNGCNSIIIASNTIFNIENGSFLNRIVKSLILVIFIIFLLAFIVIVPLFGKSIISLLASGISITNTNKELITTLFNICQVPISILIVFFLIKIIYTIAPDEKISSKHVTKGAMFTTLTTLITTWIYSYYINNIANYTLVYGNLANIVILLIWFYAIAYIFVIGLYLNKNKVEKEIDRTNAIRLEEIRQKVKNTK